MLRLTTKVTRSPASSARSSSAAARISSITSGRVSANSAVSSSSLSSSPSRPLRDRPLGEPRVDALLDPAPGPPPRDEAPVLELDHVEDPLLHPLGVHVLRVDAEPLGQREAPAAPAPCAPGAGSGRRARARCGRRWPRARRDRSPPPRPARPTSRTGSAGPGCRRPASAACTRAIRRLMSSIADRGRPARAARSEFAFGLARRRGPAAAHRSREASIGDVRHLAPVVPRVRDEVLQDHLLEVAVALVRAAPALRAIRPAPPRSRRCRRGSRW